MTDPDLTDAAAGEHRRGYRGTPERHAELIRRPGEMLQRLDGRLPDAGDVSAVFQPIVELATDRVVGYEALTRGPAGSAVEAPMDLFRLVRETGDEAAFDRACRDAALARAARDGARPPLTVFVNVEPGLLTHGPQGTDDDTWLEAPADLRCVIELTERALASRPARLLHAVSLVRELNWGVALDDVGADPASLALMAVLRPDVIKLDLRLVQQRPSTELAAIIAAVNAQAEETGAVVLAEGIETEEHLQTALAFGASLGQGWHFGRPAPLPQEPPGGCEPVRFLGSQLQAPGPTPFEVIRQERVTRRAGLGLVAALHEQLVTLAEDIAPAGVVLATHGPDGRFSARLEELDGRAALLGVLDDPSGRASGAMPEWDMVLLTPHYAAAVAAQRTGSGGEAEFDLALTHRRDVVAACARALVSRLDGRPA